LKSADSPAKERFPGGRRDQIGNKLASCRLVDKIEVKSLTVKSEILTTLVSHTMVVGDTNSVNESTISKGLTTTRDS
jgi:hypothetical protein